MNSLENEVNEPITLTDYPLVIQHHLKEGREIRHQLSVICEDLDQLSDYRGYTETIKSLMEISFVYYLTFQRSDLIFLDKESTSSELAANLTVRKKLKSEIKTFIQDSLNLIKFHEER